ncbi:Hypothetical protein FKW44_012104, partial [Caligus rogercresseyi]
QHTIDWLKNTKAALNNSIMKQARKLDRALVAKACSSSAPGSSASSTQKADGLNKQSLHICTSILCLNK